MLWLINLSDNQERFPNRNKNLKCVNKILTENQFSNCQIFTRKFSEKSVSKEKPNIIEFQKKW